jgi:hypothetical protein
MKYLVNQEKSQILDELLRRINESAAVILNNHESTRKETRAVLKAARLY